MFKKGDKVIKISDSRRFNDIFLDKVVTVKNTTPIVHRFEREVEHVWLTFEEIDDIEIGNGLSSIHFKLAVNRKDRIENIFDVL